MYKNLSQAQNITKQKKKNNINRQKVGSDREREREEHREGERDIYLKLVIISEPYYLVYCFLYFDVPLLLLDKTKQN